MLAGKFSCKFRHDTHPGSGDALFQKPYTSERHAHYFQKTGVCNHSRNGKQCNRHNTQQVDIMKLY